MVDDEYRLIARSVRVVPFRDRDTGDVLPHHWTLEVYDINKFVPAETFSDRYGLRLLVVLPSPGEIALVGVFGVATHGR